METEKERFERFQQANNQILMHDSSRSFADLIDPNRHLFSDFNLTYATNIFSSEFNSVSLSEIENKCKGIKRYLSGDSLLFYSDEIYESTIKNKSIEIPLDYSLSFDSNVAEKFNIWANGGSVHPKERFYQLIDFVKGTQFHFDYIFFILENLENSLMPENHRPFNTIMALKLFDHLDFELFTNDPDKPVFRVDKDEAARQAIDTIITFQRSHHIPPLIRQRKGIYLLLLKAILLFWQKDIDQNSKLSELVIFSLNKLGKFAKVEIYFFWKFFKTNDNHSFFDPVRQPHNKIIKKAKGMSWDLFFIRLQESLASMKGIGNFYVPFKASFDDKFVELTKACPIRFILHDDKNKNISTVFHDEYEFQKDLNQALALSNSKAFTDSRIKQKRINSTSNIGLINSSIEQLEKQIANCV
jgi:hypothetical protein